MPKCVLIVDDQASVRRATRRFFEDQNFVVCGEAINGNDGLEKARSLRPDLIIMDLAMPGMSGLEAARELRALQIETPIILFTMYEDAIRPKGAFSVVNAVVSKIDLEELQRQVTVLLAL
jgi:two-component system invasion response regulator UvrY